ncbi:hypothetical protein D9M72_445990 [compost metagenome]
MKFSIRLDEHKILLQAFERAFSFFISQKFFISKSFFYGFVQAALDDRLDQIIYGIDLIAFQGILREGRGKNNQGVFRNRFGKFQSIDSRHLYVQKNQVNGVFLHEFARFFGTIETPDHIQVRNVLQQQQHSFSRQRFVINDYAVHIGRVKVAV